MEWVKYEKNNMKIPIKSWCPNVEESAMKQAMNLSNLPFAFKHVALMPDCHSGYGMPIGGVLATKGVIIPDAVGVDIGCGMEFIQTDIPVSEFINATDTQKTPLVKAILDMILRNVPVGFNRHKESQMWDGFENAPELAIVQQNLGVAEVSLGTLGGGNHHIELQRDDKGNLCIMLHSGSRNLGKQVCDFYNKQAKKLNLLWHSSVPVEWDLAFLPIDSEDGHNYRIAMNFCLDFAKQNRYLMMERVKNIVLNALEKYVGISNVNILQTVNAHHNYAVYEHHFGENVIVHRKGAIRARYNDMGIIPGSMETPSYIVRGLGNAESFNSASHGAGRVMSRTQARKTLDVQDMVNRLKTKNIILKAPNISDTIDECGLAYKNIDEVINNENDLVEIITKVTQIGVIKG